MRKIVISSLLIVSVLIYANEDIKEVESIFKADSIITSEQVENTGTAETIHKVETQENQISENSEAETMNAEVKAVYEYRPASLRQLDAQMAIPANRGALKSLNAQYDAELMSYLESINFDSDRIFFMANQYMMMNNYAKANKIFLMDNKDLKNIFGAATIFRFMGKNSEAVHKYNEAISMDSSFAENYLGRALANRNLDNYDSAINDLKKYLSMTSSIEGYAALGDIYFKLNKGKEAYDIVAAGLSKYPDSILLKTLMNGISKSGERN